MALPVFFELHRVNDGPLYLNAAHVSSVEFFGNAKDGYVACLAVNTTHYLWGDAAALEAQLATRSFGTQVMFVTITSPAPVSPRMLFDNVVYAGLAEKDATQVSFCEFDN